MRARLGYDDVVVAAPVTVPYVRYSIRGAHWFLGRALAGLCRGCRDQKGTASTGCASRASRIAPDTAVGLTQHLGISPRWLDHIPMGGASGIVALAPRRARGPVRRRRDRRLHRRRHQPHRLVSPQRLAFSQFAADAVYPYGSGGPNASFALLTDYYMRTFGAQPEDFGKLCVAQRDNALGFPYALFKKPLTLEEYLDARMIADPLRLFDCVMPCAGAEGFLVTSRAVAERLGLAYAHLLGTIERHNAFPDDPIQFRGGWALDAQDLYDQAGVGPEDIDFVETYDDYPVMTVIQLEDLGFCRKGEGAAFVRRHELGTDGSFPLNTSGGQLSVGQAGAAGGFLGIVEAIRQLTRRSTRRTGGRRAHGLVSGFGMINYDRGLCSGAAILAAEGGHA